MGQEVHHTSGLDFRDLQVYICPQSSLSLENVHLIRVLSQVQSPILHESTVSQGLRPEALVFSMSEA